MARGKTPIERAIEGIPQDRRERYIRSLPDRGLTRVAVIVPVDQVEAIKAHAAALREAARVSGDTND